MKDKSVGTAVWKEERYQLSRDSWRWSRSPTVAFGFIAIDASIKWIPDVEMDLDGGLELWFRASRGVACRS